MSAYEVAHLDELDRFKVDEEGLVWRPVRRRLGIKAFGTNAYTAEKAGDRVVERHSEQDGPEELYFVAAGHATFRLDDVEVDAPAGTFVFCLPGTTREAHAVEDGTTVLAFGAKVGVPHEVSPWEEAFVAKGHYNAACFEAQTGNRERAIEYLRRAIELDEKALEYAREDPDFDAIRDDPEFPA